MTGGRTEEASGGGRGVEKGGRMPKRSGSLY